MYKEFCKQHVSQMYASIHSYAGMMQKTKCQLVMHILNVLEQTHYKSVRRASSGTLKSEKIIGSSEA